MSAKPQKKMSRSLSASARETLLRQSLTAPSLTRLAHAAGVTANRLYSWRQEARDGEIEVAADIRESLAQQMPPRSYTARTAAPARQTRLTRAQAQDVVISTIRRRKTTTLASIAARHGISPQTLHNMRTRARDGLIKIPNADLAILRKQMNENFRASTGAKSAKASNISATPSAPASKKKAQKTASQTKAVTKPAKPEAAVQTAAPKANAASSDVIVVRNGDRAIEIPASLDAARMAAIVSAAMAA